MNNLMSPLQSLLDDDIRDGSSDRDRTPDKVVLWVMLL